jgi:hypothetical protein
MRTNLTFGQAVEAAKQDKIVTRKGWLTKNNFVFQRPADLLSKEFIPKVKSLPDQVKSMLHSLDRDVMFRAYLCKFEGGEVVNGWIPSQEDILSDDWCILE